MRLLIQPVCIVLLFCGLLQAQPAPMKFGEVSKEILASESLTTDKEAKVVILCDYGIIEAGTTGLIFDRHVRIKILSEVGYDWATVNLFHGSEEEITDIAGLTHTLGTNGQVVKTKLERKDIFRKKVSKERQEVKFTLPALTSGSVIEYRYRQRFETPPIFLPTWYFQTTEPTLHSELRTVLPEMFGYALFKSGMIRPFDAEEHKVGLELKFKTNINRWVITNVPAVRKEPIMPGSLKDQMFRIEFQLSQYSAGDGFSINNFLNSWPAFAKALNEDVGFGKQLEKYDFIRDTANELTKNISDPEQKLSTLFKYVQSNLLWNEKERYYPERNLKEAFNSKNVDSAEQALILTAMLKAVGIEAYPVLIRTRTEGRPITLYPMLLQFDYLITYAQIGKKEFLLDATDKDLQMGLLPIRALNERGWLLHPNESEWVSIRPIGSSRQTTMTQLVISEDGQLSGKLEVQDSEYANLMQRKKMAAEKDEQQYIRNYLFGGDESFEISNLEIIKKDEPEPLLRTKLNFIKPNAASVTNERIYLPVSMYGAFSKSPFVSESRQLAIDFIVPIAEQHVLHFHIPKGYTIEERPNSVMYKLSNNSGEFRRLVQASDSLLMIHYKLNITKPQMPVQQYQGVKEMFDKMISSQADQIVFLKMKAQEPEEKTQPAPTPKTTKPEPKTAPKPTPPKPSAKPKGKN